MVGELDRAVERAFREAVAGEKLLRLGVGESGEVRLHLRADGHHLAALCVRIRLERGDVRVGGRGGEVVLRHVRTVDRLLVREEVEVAQDGQDGVALGARERAHGLAVREVGEKRSHRVKLGTLLRVALRLVARLVAPLLELLHVGENEFRLDHLRVAGGVDGCGLVAAFLHVDDVVVLEAAHNVEDCVALANVREELVAEALALRGALHETGDVGELHRRADDLLRVRDRRERLETRVLHLHDGRVRLDRAERVVLRRGLLSLRERVEQCGLAHVGQPHDSD